MLELASLKEAKVNHPSETTPPVVEASSLLITINIVPFVRTTGSISSATVLFTLILGYNSVPRSRPGEMNLSGW
jgi:hypothetical protein